MVLTCDRRRTYTPAKGPDTFRDGYYIIGEIILYQSGRERWYFHTFLADIEVEARWDKYFW